MTGFHKRPAIFKILKILVYKKGKQWSRIDFRMMCRINFLDNQSKYFYRYISMCPDSENKICTVMKKSLHIFSLLKLKKIAICKFEKNVML